MTTYTCADCGAAAFVQDGMIIRTCAHGASGIVAHLTATARGVGAAAA